MAILWALDIYALSSLADFWRFIRRECSTGVTYVLLACLFTVATTLCVGLVRHYVLLNRPLQS